MPPHTAASPSKGHSAERRTDAHSSHRSEPRSRRTAPVQPHGGFSKMSYLFDPAEISSVFTGFFLVQLSSMLVPFELNVHTLMGRERDGHVHEDDEQTACEGMMAQEMNHGQHGWVGCRRRPVPHLSPPHASLLAARPTRRDSRMRRWHGFGSRCRAAPSDHNGFDLSALHLLCVQASACSCTPSPPRKCSATPPATERCGRSPS